MTCLAGSGMGWSTTSRVFHSEEATLNTQMGGRIPAKLNPWRVNHAFWSLLRTCLRSVLCDLISPEVVI